MGKQSKDIIVEELDKYGFTWKNQVDFPNYNLLMLLGCRKCGGNFKRTWFNFNYNNVKNCPICVGKKTPNADRETLWELFKRNRNDFDSYDLYKEYIIKDERRHYKFFHKECGGYFYGSRKFFDGVNDCPVCYRIRAERNRKRRLRY